MKLPLYQLDAFTSDLFGGNPAAVVLLDHWLPDGTLQAIGRENNLSETAFTVPRSDAFELRWFTPSRPPTASTIDRAAVADALGAAPTELLGARDLLAVFPHQSDVEALSPDFAKIRALDAFAVIVTAPGDGSDFVSRFFAPRAGIDEDPVTGSAHCTLVPYWSRRLERSKLHARQVSRRGGELFCEDRGERVAIAGRAVEYLRGEITI